MIDALIESCVIVESLQQTAKPDVLREILAALVDAKRLAKRDVAVVAKQLAEREALGSTGIGNGVALPHSKQAPVKAMTLALARSADGIDYDALDGRPVQLIFMILTPAKRAEDHLAALRWVSSLARNADCRRFMIAAENASAIRDLLREMTAA